jgi:hypothetical protein
LRQTKKGEKKQLKISGNQPIELNIWRLFSVELYGSVPGSGFKGSELEEGLNPLTLNGESRLNGKPLNLYRFNPSTQNPRMKLNGTIPDGEFIFRNTIPGIGIFRNVKIQAPKYK